MFSLKPPMVRGGSGVLNSVQNTLAQKNQTRHTVKNKLRQQAFTSNKATRGATTQAVESTLTKPIDKKVVSKSRFI